MARPRKPKKLEPMSIRLDPDVKAALETVAVAEDRSVSYVANRVLRAWLDDAGAEVEAARRKLESPPGKNPSRR
jgi:predicted transcriptional regulator